VNRASIERMCACKEFQVEGADTEKAGEEKLLVIRGWSGKETRPWASCSHTSASVTKKYNLAPVNGR